jgi:hypothetical protein
MTDCLRATISRSELTLPPLSIGAEGDPIQFDGANNAANALVHAGDQWSHEWAESPWVHGETLTMARRTNSDINLRLWIKAADFPAIQTAFSELCAALRQWNYQLTAFTASTDYVWDCHPADVAMSFNRTHLWQHAANIDVSLPCRPGPTI